MRIVALDTATEVCGVALWARNRVQAEKSMRQGLTHTRVLMPILADLLEESGTDLMAVDGWVVTLGPGSFTGLRIGISAVKGLAMATGKPLVGVSTLAVLAQQAPAEASWVCPMIDARRNQVYWTLYQRQADQLLPVIPERVDSVAEALAQVRAERSPVTFIGNGARLYASSVQAHPGALLADDARHDLRPGEVARLGVALWAQGTRRAAHAIAPVYLRAADAKLPQGAS